MAQDGEGTTTRAVAGWFAGEGTTRGEATIGELSEAEFSAGDGTRGEAASGAAVSTEASAEAAFGVGRCTATEDVTMGERCIMTDCRWGAAGTIGSGPTGRG